MRKRFCREVSPLTISMDDLETDKVFAKKAMSALLALPSTGGEAMAIFKRPPCSPTIADRLAPGWA